MFERTGYEWAVEVTFLKKHSTSYWNILVLVLYFTKKRIECEDLSEFGDSNNNSKKILAGRRDECSHLQSVNQESRKIFFIQCV